MVKQFEVYWINLNPTKGSEINKMRPCVVISPDEMNMSLNTLIIAPLTSTIRNYPTRLTVYINKRKGQIALDQIRCIDKTRLGNKVTSLNTNSITTIKELLQAIFT